MPIAIIAAKEALQFLQNFGSRFSPYEVKRMRECLVKFLKMKSGQRKDEYFEGCIKQYLNKIALSALHSAEKTAFTALLDFA